MAEISDDELAVLQRSKKLLDKLWNDPKDGMSFKKKVKEVLPDVSIPELDIVENATRPLMERLAQQDETTKSLRDRLDSWEKSKKDSEEESSLRQQLDSVRKTYSFTEDGMTKVVERMREKNNPDAEAAAAWVARQEQKAQPLHNSNLLPSTMNLFGSKSEDSTWKDLNLDPQGWGEREAIKILNEFEQADAA